MRAAARLDDLCALFYLCVLCAKHNDEVGALHAFAPGLSFCSGARAPPAGAT